MSGINGYTKEELAELSEEELEGLKELAEEAAAEEDAELDDGLTIGEPDEKSAAEEKDETEAVADADAEETGDNADDTQDKSDTPAASNEAGDETGDDSDQDTSSEASSDQDKEAGEDDDASSSTAPQPTFVAPSDLQDRLDAITKEKRELAEQFDEGEITASERLDAEEKLDQERDELFSQKVRAQVSDDLGKQAFLTAATNFVDDPDNADFKPGTRLYKMLDNEVRDLQKANPKAMFDPKYIEQAAKGIREELGLEDPKVTRAKQEQERAAAEAARKKDKGKKTEKGLAAIPPTLADLPASDPTEDDGSGFAALDRLADTDYLAYERALMKLEQTSPADFDAYMQSRNES